MSPSKKDKRRVKTRGASVPAAATKWSVAFYRTAEEMAPARKFLLGCPQPVREMLLAIVVAVRDAPPPSFPPSKMWHAMHGEMKGLYEARDEHDGRLYRVFCVLDSQAPEHGLDAKALTLICGAAKKVRSAMDQRVYDEALAYRTDYLATRRIVLPMGVPEDPGKT
ncbi:MAG TPA: hypothetical protein VIJ66_04415 [Solirubrobacteraceae bacterium]